MSSNPHNEVYNYAQCAEHYAPITVLMCQWQTHLVTQECKRMVTEEFYIVIKECKGYSDTVQGSKTKPMTSTMIHTYNF